MAPEQRVLFREHFTREARPSVSIKDFEVQTGAVMPPNVQLHSVPQIDTYQHGYVADRYVVVDPSSRRVMEISH